MITQEKLADSSNHLFDTFLDPVDMIGSFDADTTIETVNRFAAANGLHFPLSCDPSRSLRDHFGTTEYTPASSRFGAYVDNVPGMNWELPNGKLVRIGERVIKSTTGYDLLRYLLHAGENFGRAKNYVIRLRPKTEGNYAGMLKGSDAALKRAASEISQSSWCHWIDCMDWVQDESNTHIELRGGCLPGEEALFHNTIRNVVKQHGAAYETTHTKTTVPLPAFAIKSVPSACRDLASYCVEQLGGSARVLLINGYVMLYPGRKPTLDMLNHINRKVAPCGGHLFAPQLLERTLDRREHGWVETILKEWAQA